jgi:tRNA (uracil-5-)-methyltransferase
MTCKHFGSCGSCGLYALGYEEQLQRKKEKVSALLVPFYTEAIEVFDSPDSHYRARSEFRIWHEGDRCNYAMGNIQKKGAITIEECPKVIEPIEKRMWKLIEKINASKEVLKRKLFAVEFLATTTDECLITMLYHRKLDDTWSAEAKLLEEELDCKIMGRSRKQKVILSDEFVTEKLEIDGRTFTYVQYESGFTQPNPAVNVKMIEWAVSQAKKVGYGDFLESYCGLGNFTLPLSHHFDKSR